MSKRESYYTDDELMRYGFIEHEITVEVLSYMPKSRTSKGTEMKMFPWRHPKLELVADNRWIYDPIDHRWIHSIQASEYINNLIENTDNNNQK